MMRFGIVICSREQSTRLPKKAFQLVDGKSVIERLIEQLKFLDMPVIVAIPFDDLDKYQALNLDATIYASPEKDDPLARTVDAAHFFELDAVIRITHDKIFIDRFWLENAIKDFEDKKIDYLYCPRLQAGTGFEIIARSVLERAAIKYKNVEFISYAARLESHRTLAAEYKRDNATKHNLLIDFPEDLKLMELIYSQIPSPDLTKVLRFLNENHWLAEINSPPLVTVYTCVHNGAKFLKEAMDSVVAQIGFDKQMEYIIVDDASTDQSCIMAAHFALQYPNVRWIRNHRNKGLSSSSNIAIKQARGKYVIRLDADDYFTEYGSVMELVGNAITLNCEIVYPNNHFGNYDKIQRGIESHHVGGAIFDKKALNFISFTDGLRGYEGLDLFLRAREKLTIGYYEKPLFFYRQHSESMSKKNLEERSKIKAKILEQHP